MIKDFGKYVKDHIKDYLPSDYSDAQLKLINTRKSNGRNYTGLLIRNNLNREMPTIYLDDFEQDLTNGSDIKEVMNDIASTIITTSDTDIPKVSDSIIDSLLDYEKVKPMLSLRMCDLIESTDFLSDKPYTPLGNLAVTYRIQVFHEGDYLATTVIDNNLLKIWNVSKSQLHKDALKAESDRNEVKLYANTLNRIPLAEMENFYNSEGPIKREFQYFLTNEQYTNGACVIALNGVLKHIGELLQDDYYIIPSSIHEVVIEPVSNSRLNLKQMDLVVQSGNQLLDTIDDKLSDHVMLYNRKTNKLRYNRY